METEPADIDSSHIVNSSPPYNHHIAGLYIALYHSWTIQANYYDLFDLKVTI